MSSYKPLLVIPLMFAVIIPIAMNQQDDVIQTREKKSTECDEFFYKRNGICSENVMFSYNHNSDGFKEYVEKKIYGRIVQIETGNHVILESGQSFAIHEGFEDVWVNDIVEIDKIRFEPTACQLTSLQFNNSTEYFLSTAPFIKNSWIYDTPLEERTIISNEEMISLAQSYSIQLDEKLGHQRYYVYGTNFIVDDTDYSCEKESVYKVKKLQSEQQVERLDV